MYHERLTVVNDWPDREAVAILARCAEAARPSGRVVVPDAGEIDGAQGAVDRDDAGGWKASDFGRVQ